MEDKKIKTREDCSLYSIGWVYFDKCGIGTECDHPRGEPFEKCQKYQLNKESEELA